MKESYIKPHLKWVNIYQESLMLGLSEKIIEEEDDEEYDEAANDFVFEDYEQYWKSRRWQ